VTWGGISGF